MDQILLQGWLIHFSESRKKPHTAALSCRCMMGLRQHVAQRWGVFIRNINDNFTVQDTLDRRTLTEKLGFSVFLDGFLQLYIRKWIIKRIHVKCSCLNWTYPAHFLFPFTWIVLFLYIFASIQRDRKSDSFSSWKLWCSVHWLDNTLWLLCQTVKLKSTYGGRVRTLVV